MAALGFLDGVRLPRVRDLLRPLGQELVVGVQDLELLTRQVLDADQAVARAFQGGHELVELELDGQAVLVLRLLDQEHHQEGDDRGPGVDHELPGVREMEERAGDPQTRMMPSARAKAGTLPVNRVAADAKRSKTWVWALS